MHERLGPSHSWRIVSRRMLVGRSSWVGKWWHIRGVGEQESTGS